MNEPHEMRVGTTSAPGESTFSSFFILLSPSTFFLFPSGLPLISLHRPPRLSLPFGCVFLTDRNATRAPLAPNRYPYIRGHFPLLKGLDSVAGWRKSRIVSHHRGCVVYLCHCRLNSPFSEGAKAASAPRVISQTDRLRRGPLSLEPPHTNQCV